MSEETKKMLAIIEKQYKEERQRINKKEKANENKKFLLGALIFLNIFIFLILLAR